MITGARTPERQHSLLFELMPGASRDICARKHQGNAESVSAHRDIADSKEKQKARVLAFIKSNGTHGATVDEIAVAFRTTPNSVSGRCSELYHIDRLIERAGRRPTRSGSTASVYVTKENRRANLSTDAPAATQDEV